MPRQAMTLRKSAAIATTVVILLVALSAAYIYSFGAPTAPGTSGTAAAGGARLAAPERKAEA